MFLSDALSIQYSVYGSGRRLAGRDRTETRLDYSPVILANAGDSWGQPRELTDAQLDPG